VIKISIYILLAVQLASYIWFGWEYFAVPEGHVPKNIIILHIVAILNLILLAGLLFIKIKYSFSSTMINIGFIMAILPGVVILVFYIQKFIPR